MEGVLWYLLASSRGGGTRVQILQVLDDQPRNANQIAEELNLDYTTVRHHLDVLVDNNVLKKTGNGYGDIYLFTDQLERNRDTFREILDTIDTE